MPKFADEKLPISVDTDGEDNTFVITVGRKKMVLNHTQAKALSQQIGYAVEFTELYARGPR